MVNRFTHTHTHTHTQTHTHRIELRYNIMKVTEYFVFLTEECKVMLSNEELIGTLYTRRRVNLCRYNRVWLYMCVCVY